MKSPQAQYLMINTLMHVQDKVGILLFGGRANQIRILNVED